MCVQQSVREKQILPSTRYIFKADRYIHGDNYREIIIVAETIGFFVANYDQKKYMIRYFELIFRYLKTFFVYFINSANIL